MPPTPDAAALAAAVAALPVVVEEASCEVGEVAVPTYPGGARPSGTVRVAGGGAEGHGEHVAWTMEAQRALASQVVALVPVGRSTVGAWSAELAQRTPDPYVRAALEAAAIDLACQQAGTSLFVLASCPPRATRYVVSFERRADPADEIRRQRAEAPWIEFKVDVDTAWGDRVWEDLAVTDAVAVLDFKGRGTAADHERAHRALPEAWLEDATASLVATVPETLRRRLSIDDGIHRAAEVAALPLRPGAVNVKPARLGGALEALRTIAACRDAGIDVYVGGMFEVGIGRRQLWTLASLCCPEGPNDVAPIGTGDTAPDRPRALLPEAGTTAFGAAVDGLR